ncbi:Epidermal growth factor receptor substrate 15 [Mortierella sp. AD011]|nr:Epidermal growth factor receptor substrate 15 [Mortierella sp. AD011]
MVQVTHAKALFDCVGDEESELSFQEGDILVDVRETSEEGWLHGRLERTGEEGLFPDNYVEIMHVNVETPTIKLNAPQLPARSQANAVTTSVPVTPIRQDLATLNTAVTKPLLPARKDPTSGVNAASSKVVLPGMATKSMHAGSFKHEVASQGGLDLGRALSGPPALPKRGNTFHENSNASAVETTTPAESALSVRERMANLSMASQRQGSAPSTPTSIIQPTSLPPRPTGAIDSPLSSAARPALPRRADNSAESTSQSATKHVYQVEDAAVPVPKLTTFSRPRSARTGKSSGSLTQKETPPSTPTTDISTPPKLPSRPVSVATTPSSNAISASKATSSPSTGPVRFSPAAIKQSPADFNSALPSISRNAQPLPLPSRTNLNPTPASSTKTIQDSPKPTTPGTLRASGASQNDAPEDSSAPAGSVFGVKLNSVGSRATSHSALETDSPASESDKDVAPPLPVRSSTMPSTHSGPSEAPTTAPMRLQSSNARPFSSSMSGVSQINQSRPTPASNSNYSQSSHKPSMYESQTLGYNGAWSTMPLMPLMPQSSRTTPGTRVAMPPPRLPETTAPETMGVKPDARRRYEALFHSVTSGEYIEGAKVHAIYVRSRLDSKTLAQIWDMVDVDNSGRLNQAQFCMGLYLIDERLASGLIPLEVSDELWVSVMQ